MNSNSLKIGLTTIVLITFLIPVALFANSEKTKSIYFDSIENTVVFKLNREVDKVSAKLIDDYLMKREGVSFSNSDIILFEVKISLKENVDPVLIEQLLRYAEHLYVKHEKCSN
jgi:hypothetical protein